MNLIKSQVKESYKVVLLGDSSVGKSSVIQRYINKTFYESVEPTIGASFFSSEQLIDDKIIKLDIWDTAGQERYKSLAPMYYRGAQVAIVIYDITNKDSFRVALDWIRELKERALNCKIYLIGNKVDLDDSREVTCSDINNLNYQDIECYDVSAKTNKNIEFLFNKIIIDLSDRQNLNQEHPEQHVIDFNINETNNIGNKKRCCN